jgi:hypothetical protein
MHTCRDFSAPSFGWWQMFSKEGVGALAKLFCELLHRCTLQLLQTTKPSDSLFEEKINYYPKQTHTDSILQ